MLNIDSQNPLLQIFYEANSVLNACNTSGVAVRIFGLNAIYLRCPQYTHLINNFQKSSDTINVASYSKHSQQISKILTGLGYIENQAVFTLSTRERAFFYKTEHGPFVNVYYEKLDFNHTLSLKNRLEIDMLTLPLLELFLEKMQIVAIKREDLIEANALLLAFPLSKIDKGSINIKLAAELCANDWGLWYTVSENLKQLKQQIPSYTFLTAEQRKTTEAKVNEFILRLHAEPKTMAWRVRDQLGTRVKWYKDIETIE